jgi:hypothetical protein
MEPGITPLNIPVCPVEAEELYSRSAVAAVTVEKTLLRTASAVLRTVRRITTYCLLEIGIQWRFNLYYERAEVRREGSGSCRGYRV